MLYISTELCGLNEFLAIMEYHDCNQHVVVITLMWVLRLIIIIKIKT